MIKRLSDEKNPKIQNDIQELIKLIKNEWMLRLEEGGQSSGAPSEGIMSTMGYRVGDTQGVRQEYRIL